MHGDAWQREHKCMAMHGNVSTNALLCMAVDAMRCHAFVLTLPCIAFPTWSVFPAQRPMPERVWVATYLGSEACRRSQRSRPGGPAPGPNHPSAHAQ